MALFNSLLLAIWGASHKELARQFRYFGVENQILRSRLPARITITAKERQRLVKFGVKLGKAIRQLVTIVSPGTFLRWVREAKQAARPGTKPAKRGRRRIAEEIRQLVLRMARENRWGYCRILGELKKLRIRSISQTTIKNILKA